MAGTMTLTYQLAFGFVALLLMLQILWDCLRRDRRQR